MIFELSGEQYQETFTSKMLDVTETAAPVIDIWPYVELLVKEKIVADYVFQNELAEKIYRTNNNLFDHILLPTQNVNIFIVVVVDLSGKKMKGHYKLDLNEKYSL